jgi:ketosteroid isomerase-like protein
MKWIHGLAVAAICCLALSGWAIGTSGNSAADGKEELERWNAHYRDLHLKMDTAGIFALWADDGVDLMPGEAPMVGKKVIQAWVENILSKMPGYRVTKQEMEFRGIEVSGDWASEWALEHQVVQPPDGKEPIETWGKMALVLHREANGDWKIKQEMWNAAPKR